MRLENFHYKKILDNLYDGLYFLDDNKKIICWNSGAQKHTGYKQSEIIGTHCWDSIRHSDNQGNELCDNSCPVSQSFADGVLREVEVFFTHKNGHKVPAFLRITPIENRGNQAVMAVELLDKKSPKFTLREKLVEMQKLALLDPLVSIGNRRFIETTINSKLEELRRYDWPFGILFIDLDNFKDINDRYGHDTGDMVLKMVSKTLHNSKRSFDFLGRWGGEEFIAIFVNLNNDQLYAISERVRHLAEQSRLKRRSGNIGVTVSIGATLAQKRDTTVTLIKRADRLMYKSKKSGKNCTTVG
jgi:diguanylate cyclase (GGDEF)-like protein/PAS domain S-box-containing protein